MGIFSKRERETPETQSQLTWFYFLGPRPTFVPQHMLDLGRGKNREMSALMAQTLTEVLPVRLLLHSFSPFSALRLFPLSFLFSPYSSSVRSRLVGNQKYTRPVPSAAAHPLFHTAHFSFLAVWPRLKCQPGLIGNPCLLGLIGLASQECSTGIPPAAFPTGLGGSFCQARLPTIGCPAPLLAAQPPSSGAPPHCIPVWGTHSMLTSKLVNVILWDRDLNICVILIRLRMCLQSLT